jgi:hypothetical protein
MHGGTVPDPDLTMGAQTRTLIGMRLRALALALVVFSISGCPESNNPPPPPDGALADGSDIDSSLGIGVDTDGDGVCDRTEMFEGTDPMLVDTDGDGFTDRVELDFGFDPTRPDSPERTSILFMEETEVATAQFPVEVVVRGSGESFSGSFEALPVADLAGINATNMYVGSFAVGAMPRDNVFEIQSDEETFVSVVGNTQLTFEVRFAFGLNLPRLCTRAYPFRYNVQNETGALIDAGRYLLIILPDGERLDTTEWCQPERCI